MRSISVLPRCVAAVMLVVGVVLASFAIDGSSAHALGRAWSIVPSPHEGPDAANNRLKSVSCIAPDECMAVGQYWTGSRNDTLVQR